VAAVEGDYARYEFHLVVQRLQTYCSEDLGGFYLDVLKDRLYTTGAGSTARRSAQNALHHITHGLLRLMAPILSFTAEEAWRVIAGKQDDSVFFHTWHEFPQVPDGAALLARWREIRTVRSEVQKELETLRAAGKIGSSLAANVEIKAAGSRFEAFGGLGDETRFVTITSKASVTRAVDGAEAIVATASSDHKCERCWHYRADVGADPAHPTICARCVSNLYGAGETRCYA